MNLWIFIFPLALATITFCLKLLLLSKMRQGDANRVFASESDIKGGVRPAELAYLVSAADMTQTMIVLVVDLMQRAVKVGSTGDTSSAPYEQKIFDRVKDDLQGLGHGQVEKLLPPPITEKPVQFMQFIYKCYRFFTRGLRQFLQKTIADPKHLRKYFSPKALFYVVADLFSSGYQPIVEAEISAHLKRQGLLIDTARLQVFSRIFACVFIISWICLLLIIALFTHQVWLTVIAWVMASFNACCLRAIWYLRSFIPLYDELSAVTKDLRKQNWRIAFVKGGLRLVSIVVTAAIALVSVLVLCLESAIIFLIRQASSLPAAMQGSWSFLFAIVCMTFACLVILDLGLESYFLTTRPQASVAGLSLIKKYRKDLVAANPVQAFKDMLVSPDYDPSFGYLLAIYGLGTLWILL
jgi:hypothetical protein